MDINSSQKPRNTKQKSIILNILKENKSSHITVEKLYEELINKKTPVPKATIYRNLATLEKNKIVRKYINADIQGACYQFIEDSSLCEEHYHFLCNECNEVLHFSDASLQSAMNQLTIAKGLKIDISKTVFYGVCDKCEVF